MRHLVAIQKHIYNCSQPEPSMYKKYDTFILVKPLNDITVPVGSLGVVLLVLGGEPHSYEVEFPDGRGWNIGKEISYSITADSMRPHERPPYDK